MHFKEYSQTLKLTKDWESYGEDRVILRSSAWDIGDRYIIRNGDAHYFLMLCTGAFICIPKPEVDRHFGDECVIVKIANREGLGFD